MLNSWCRGGHRLLHVVIEWSLDPSRSSLARSLASVAGEVEVARVKEVFDVTLGLEGGPYPCQHVACCILRHVYISRRAQTSFCVIKIKTHKQW
jgi:hypothetical protein